MKTKIDSTKYAVKLNEFYRLKVSEFLVRLEQSKQMIPNHNLSVGIIGENILRSFLQDILPKRYQVTQGFVEYNGDLSRQCDIIIYDSHNYAPLATWGDIEIIPFQAVIMVVEVKSTINFQRFKDVLTAFDHLNRMRVVTKFLFVFNTPKIETLSRWFTRCKTSEDRNNEEQDFYCSDNHLYDVSDLESLPTGIVGLDKGIFLNQDHIQTENNDYYGYSAWTIIDNSDKPMSSLQCFSQAILTYVADWDAHRSTHSLTNTSETNDNDLKNLRITAAIPLCPI